MDKNYCDRCGKLDRDCSALVHFSVKSFEYTNLAYSIRAPFTVIEKLLMRSFVGFTPLALCPECTISFFEFRKLEKGVPDETPNTDNEELTNP